MDDGIERFFDFARERHQVYLRRERGDTYPWTTDHILQTYRFTNVFRELDRTTVWFRENVRDPMRNDPNVLLATVLFRWFNRITTGGAIFNQRDLFTVEQEGEEAHPTAFSMFLATRQTHYLKSAITNICGEGPYVTGSYIIKTPNGMSKLEGVLDCVGKFADGEFADGKFDLLPRQTGEHFIEHADTLTLEGVHGWLTLFAFMGDFMAYEVVTDLRHTGLLERATDIMTWANPGPGAMRGLRRVFWGRLDARLHRSEANPLMQSLLAFSSDDKYWPQDDPERWPAWEMREVEHTLCEFDKYERARLGEGRPRGRFRP